MLQRDVGAAGTEHLSGGKDGWSGRDLRFPFVKGPLTFFHSTRTLWHLSSLSLAHVPAANRRKTVQSVTIFSGLFRELSALPRGLWKVSKLGFSLSKCAYRRKETGSSIKTPREQKQVAQADELKWRSVDKSLALNKNKRNLAEQSAGTDCLHSVDDSVDILVFTALPSFGSWSCPKPAGKLNMCFCKK